jgi:2-desacetyl-2-hydroxyethyl bacteriochlorophyllide A dehydrogenase
VKTIILEEPGLLRLTDTESPAEPAPGEALVRVHRVGICGSDLHAFAGRQNFLTYPRILGHELGVEIVAIGPTEDNLDLTVGDRCAVEPYLNDGLCIACRRGKYNCCTDMKVLGVQTDGGMRELITVPLEKLHKSETLALDQLALVEMLSIGAHAVRRAQVEPEENVLVIGAGPIGLSVVQFARVSGANVIVMDISDRRLEFCRQHSGAGFYIDAKDDPAPQLQAFLSGGLPTAVFDATGSANSMMKAFSYVAHSGRLIFVGHVGEDITFHDPDFHSREMTLMASRNATSQDFLWVIKMLEEGKIDLAPWITHRVSPEQIIVEFPSWLDPRSGVLKAMLEF